MVQPTNKVQIKNISVAEWDNPKGKSFTIQKSFKRKEDADWTTQGFTAFYDEMVNLRDALTEMIDKQPKQ